MVDNKIIDNKAISSKMVKNDSGVKITVLFDSEISKSCKKSPSLRTGWGLSLYIEFEDKRVLFDTGSDGKILINNMMTLGIKPGTIDLIFISHNHKDHVGGLFELSNLIKHDTPIVVLPGYATETNFVVNAHGIVLEMKRKEASEILDNIYTTGVLGTHTKEQSLLLKTKKGIVIITGCSHPGLTTIINSAKTLGNIYAIIGGFHKWYKKDKDLEIFKGIKKIYPIHCSIEKKKLKEKFKGNVYIPKVGDVIEI